MRDFLEQRVASLDNPRRIGKSPTGKYSVLWRYRVGNYRVICELQGEALVVLVVRIGHRKPAYR
ncbi:type II toxin-antitoxin system RelE family toxin [Nitrococcus mobilis]|uniref:type II toxin-antitoxin system RelE family toxin n=1 Tax=Nitrococcus mobilis TaxID=35797 RepID=UPI0018DBE7BE|nr:type II toxin-antitoxin system RelE/ParE family toxin [Nitrococcus mobilis]